MYKSIVKLLDIEKRKISSGACMRLISSMSFKIIITLFLVLPIEVSRSTSEVKTWIKSGYWNTKGSVIPVSAIDSTLFTHLVYTFAHINSSTDEVYIVPSDEPNFSNFTTIVQKKNPSVTTLVAITAEGDANSSDFFAMVSRASRRISFIKSSIRTARLYGFQGIELSKVPPSMGTDMTNLGALLGEWRAAMTSESKKSGNSRLILTMSGSYSPTVENSTSSFPVNSMGRNLDWFTIMSFDYHFPLTDPNFTAAPAALYDPSSKVNTDDGIKEWIAKGLPASKMVLGMVYYGYVWLLVNPKDNAIGSPARGPAITTEGFALYKYIKDYMRSNGAASVYNATYVVNYCTILSFYWVGYDDVEAIRTKVTYAKDKGLLGYAVAPIGADDNWVLSKAVQQEDKTQGNKKLLFVIMLPTIVVLTLLLGTLMWHLRRTVLRRKVMKTMTTGERSESRNLQVFSLAEIKAFTSNFSRKNKLGEGGYGPVYKGKLPDGQEIAVKRLSETSKQGIEEFKNEVTLTAKLQHVNLVRLLGYCTEREEKLLIYEYMPNKSLDFYLYDSARRQLLDWKKWLQIIEGVTQGLLYLQEYSRMTIIHRDLKASNILLDNDMKPKISDFGLAKIFQKDEEEANTRRIVGTYGYLPPEYVKDGIYSTKYDVYSFGVLLLQIISGKKNSCLCGLHGNLTLLEYAYELWKDGKGMEFLDPLLDDASSSCKIMLCLQVALLCVQEKWQDRPSMLEVSSMLKIEIDAVPTPKRPGFSKNKDEEEEENNFKPRQEICSNNVVTLSEIEPR